MLEVEELLWKKIKKIEKKIQLIGFDSMVVDIY